MKQWYTTLAAACALAPAVAMAGAWHEGGTLHAADPAEWRDANRANRLATAADFAAQADEPDSMQQLRNRAVTLRGCITKSTDGSAADAMTVADIAEHCVEELDIQ